MISEDRAQVLDESIDDVYVNETNDDESVAIPQYTITSYGWDFDVHGLVRRLQEGEIVVPDFQRDFVWTPAISSRFIESLLLGLPVPGIFLYRMENDRFQVIDGQQRLKTLRRFREGQFNGKPVKLVGLESDFDQKTYKELSGSDRRRLDNSIIHATVIRQDQPDDNGSSKFSIFERLNTNAKPLSPQEIRAAIYQGAFNDLLFELNQNQDWRSLFGKKHSRKRDEELILRFLALESAVGNYKLPMKRFLNDFMFKNRNLELESADEMRNLFAGVVHAIRSEIGKDALKPARAVNAALSDALLVAMASRIDNQGASDFDIKARYDALLQDAEFLESISGGTAQPAKVRRRIELATRAFSARE